MRAEPTQSQSCDLRHTFGGGASDEGVDASEAGARVRACTWMEACVQDQQMKTLRIFYLSTGQRLTQDTWLRPQSEGQETPPYIGRQSFMIHHQLEDRKQTRPEKKKILCQSHAEFIHEGGGAKVHRES